MSGGVVAAERHAGSRLLVVTRIGPVPGAAQP
jgi:hypothetical protein